MAENDTEQGENREKGGRSKRGRKTEERKKNRREMWSLSLGDKPEGVWGVRFRSNYNVQSGVMNTFINISRSNSLWIKFFHFRWQKIYIYDLMFLIRSNSFEPFYRLKYYSILEWPMNFIQLFSLSFPLFYGYGFNKPKDRKWENVRIINFESRITSLKKSLLKCIKQSMK